MKSHLGFKYNILGSEIITKTGSKLSKNRQGIMEPFSITRTMGGSCYGIIKTGTVTQKTDCRFNFI